MSRILDGGQRQSRLRPHLGISMLSSLTVVSREGSSFAMSMLNSMLKVLPYMSWFPYNSIRKVVYMAGRQHTRQAGGDLVYITQLPHQIQNNTTYICTRCPTEVPAAFTTQHSVSLCKLLAQRPGFRIRAATSDQGSAELELVNANPRSWRGCCPSFMQ
jgi:hypothetical protein